MVDAYPEAADDQNEDPVLDGYTRAYGAAFAAYARDELAFKTDMTYTLTLARLSASWRIP